jgi:hypothetical protein
MQLELEQVKRHEFISVLREAKLKRRKGSTATRCGASITRSAGKPRSRRLRRHSPQNQDRPGDKTAFITTASSAARADEVVE